MPTITTSYAVIDGKEVIVEVSIGDGQPGGSSLFIGAVLVTSGDERIDWWSLGPGEALRGRTLTVSGMAQNERPETDHTSMVVRLSGGIAAQAFTQHYTAREKHQKVSFITQVTFL